MTDVDKPIGVDVSYYQSVIKWNLVKQAGYDFAFVKATEGVGYEDPKFRTNWDGAQEAGLYTGAYHFARVSKSPTIYDDAKKEADWFVKTMGDLTGRLPPVLDIEWDKKADKVVSAAEVIVWCATFLQHISMRTLRVPMIYTGPSFFRYRLLSTTSLNIYPLWEANYTTAPQPKKMAAWPSWTFWQHSSTTKVPGINGNVDANRFNGTYEQLQKLAGVEDVVSASPTAETVRETVELPADLPKPQTLLDLLLGYFTQVFTKERTDRQAPP